MRFSRRTDMGDFAQVRVHDLGAAATFSVQIAREARLIDTARYTGLFKCFAGSGRGKRGVVVNTTFGECPATGTGADKEELNSAVAQNSIADRCNDRSMGGAPATAATVDE